MQILTVDELESIIAPNSSLVGLDLGTKTIGIAVSDAGLRFATPRPVLLRKKFSTDAQQLVELTTSEKIAGFILGMPVNMNGTPGPRAQATRAFARSLAPLIKCPIAFWDERLTTVEAEKAMIAADVSRKKRKEKIDSAAAAIILQGALDRITQIRIASK